MAGNGCVLGRNNSLFIGLVRRALIVTRPRNPHADTVSLRRPSRWVLPQRPAGTHGISLEWLDAIQGSTSFSNINLAAAYDSKLPSRAPSPLTTPIFTTTTTTTTPTTLTMPITITAHPLPPHPLLSLLQSHLPPSLTLLRRLQFATNSSPTSRGNTNSIILHATYTPDDTFAPDTPDTTPTHHFATAHLNLHLSPETELFLFSSLESHCPFLPSPSYPLDPISSPDPTPTPSLSPSPSNPQTTEISLPPAEIEKGVSLLLALLRRIRALEAEIPLSTERKIGRGKVIVGSLHEAVRQRLLEAGVRMGRTQASGVIAGEGGWEFCGKWLFPPSGAGVGGEGGVLGEGMRWDVVRRGDVGVVQARTAIPRQE